MIQAVLFDYGLVLTGPPDPAAWQSMQEITGLGEAAFSEAYWAPRHGYDRGTHTGGEYWAAVRPGLSAEQIAALIAADTRLWTQPNQPMIDWALRLQAAGTRTGILSNLGDAMMHGVLARFPWLDGFTHHTWSHTLLLAKPEPAIYAHAVRGLGVAAGEILFVDDREENIAGALAAGMQATRYLDHAEFVAEMERRNLRSLWLEGK